MHTANRSEIEDARTCPSGSGTNTGYSVEARYSYRQAIEVGGMILDNRWRKIPIVQRSDGPGIPTPRLTGSNFGQRACGLLTYAEAEAHRWWFICLVRATSKFGVSLCLETRIVEHKINYSYDATPQAYLNAFDNRGDLPEDMAEATKAQKSASAACSDEGGAQ